MGVVHGKVGDDDGDGEGDGEHAADCAQAAHDHAQVSLDDGGREEEEVRSSDEESAYSHTLRTSEKLYLAE